jgi:REP element-mobilizing transposase RayT
MANTYTQIIIQIVFSTLGRENLIRESFREELEKYITSIIQNDGSKLLSIYCMPDHCHALIGLHPQESVSNLVKNVKSKSSKWIAERKFVKGKFSWQIGYGAFSYSRDSLDNVVKYILNQPQHHEKDQQDFKAEYIRLLKEFKIDYDDRYVF